MKTVTMRVDIAETKNFQKLKSKIDTKLYSNHSSFLELLLS
jgi:hypothetical protein